MTDIMSFVALSPERPAGRERLLLAAKLAAASGQPWGELVLSEPLIARLASETSLVRGCVANLVDPPARLGEVFTATDASGTTSWSVQADASVTLAVSAPHGALLGASSSRYGVKWMRIRSYEPADVERLAALIRVVAPDHAQRVQDEALARLRREQAPVAPPLSATLADFIRRPR